MTTDQPVTATRMARWLAQVSVSQYVAALEAWEADIRADERGEADTAIEEALRVVIHERGTP